MVTNKVFLLLALFAATAHAKMQAEFNSRTAACSAFSGTNNTPYKIHLINDALVDSKVYPFQLTVAEGVTPQISLVTELSYPDNEKTFVNRYGAAINISNAVGLYVQFDDGSEEEITRSAIPILRKNTGENIFGGKVFYRLKQEASAYGNGSIELTSRFEITCN